MDTDLRRVLEDRLYRPLRLRRVRPGRRRLRRRVKYRDDVVKAGDCEEFTHEIVQRHDGYAVLVRHLPRRRHQRTKPSAGNVFNLREVDDEIGPAVCYRGKQLGLKGLARLSIDAPSGVQNEMVAEARLSDFHSRFLPGTMEQKYV
jgi:hypothetical protein